MHKCNNAVTNGGTLLGITCSSVPSFYASLGKTHKYANTRMNSIILFQRTYNTPGTTLLTVHFRFLFQKQFGIVHGASPGSNDCNFTAATKRIWAVATLWDGDAAKQQTTYRSFRWVPITYGFMMLILIGVDQKSAIVA